MHDDSAVSLITARLLATASYTAAANALIAALSAFYGGGWFAVQAALAAALVFCHVRTAFDCRVFADFAQGRYTPETFDQTLRETGLRRRVSDGRSMAHRAAGALSLWRTTLYLTAAQLAVLAVQAV
ncbi:hypothetical protein ACG2K1_05160 [Neisseria sp. 23W00296]|uniref:hypothetical protein n=1 Tax=unclassified Neisseria TaxID=2623750 RepID=UPI0002A1EA32|nr:MULTISPECIES: hypothetical protein [unclassified Neisseria]ASP17896.1 hypothetical protein CGZ77_09170 [Neisseria sp. KEM232]EKY04516.1 hypothetical protein HMPREF9120_02312 [Neisseria sp. oral taxon 020 str. F0370]